MTFSDILNIISIFLPRLASLPYSWLTPLRKEEREEEGEGERKREGERERESEGERLHISSCNNYLFSLFSNYFLFQFISVLILSICIYLFP